MYYGPIPSPRGIVPIWWRMLPACWPKSGTTSHVVAARTVPAALSEKG